MQGSLDVPTCYLGIPFLSARTLKGRTQYRTIALLRFLKAQPRKLTVCGMPNLLVRAD